MDARGAPQGIRHGHLPDEGGDLGADGWAASGAPAREWVQYSRKRRRCHRRTVSGETMTRACRQLVQGLASPSACRAREAGSGPTRPSARGPCPPPDAALALTREVLTPRRPARR
jgi:hypothetical protein